MRFSTLVLVAMGLVGSKASPLHWYDTVEGGGQLAFLPASTPQAPTEIPTSFARQTEAEAAVSGRKMLLEKPVGTLATTFSLDREDGLAGFPFTMMEYQAPHPVDPSSLLLILMPISTTTKNILADPQQRATFHLQNEAGRMNQERISLIGNVTIERDLTAAEHLKYAAQYLKHHPDAAPWLPSNKASPHTSWWARLDPQALYYVGGFGDTKWIGPISLELWKNAAVE